MKYYCRKCDYHTTDSSNWCKHKNSKKHILKCNKDNNKKMDGPQLPSTPPKNEEIKVTELNKIIQCSFCLITFKKTYGLSRHLKTCPMKELKHQVLEN